MNDERKLPEEPARPSEEPSGNGGRSQEGISGEVTVGPGVAKRRQGPDIRDSGEERQLPAGDDRWAPAEDLIFVLGSSRRTSLRRIEEELGELWLTTGEEARVRGRGGVVRVRELNLVVYARGEEMARQIGDVVGRVAQCHPARVIVLLEHAEGEGGEGELEAWVTAACYLTHEGGRQVCWEQITLPASGQAVPKLFAAAVPLLVPELPVALWWPGEPELGGRLFRRLGEIADRLVLDSAGFRHPGQGLRALQELNEDPGRAYILDDLNWARLTVWREMLAEPFDDPAHRALLRRLTRLEISYEDEELYGEDGALARPAASRALLLAGWLASRLGWEPAGTGWHRDGRRFVTSLRNSSGAGSDLELVLLPRVSSQCPGGGLGEVALDFEPTEPGERSCMLISRSPDSCVCAARFLHGGREDLMKTVEMSLPTEDKLLCEELDYVGRDDVYTDALTMAADLAALPGNEALWE